MDYIVVLSVIVTLLVIIPFIATCCKGGRGGDDYLISAYEPFIARILFFGLFATMLQIVNEEREQCRHNQSKVQKFVKLNDCGDEFSKIDTHAVSN